MPLLNVDDSVLLIIDIQEKLVNAAFNSEQIKNKSKILAQAANILEIPCIITEQYPKGLGNTIQEITKVNSSTKYFEKTEFNALNEEKVLDYFNNIRKSQIIICGIETHICVRQTVSALLSRGFQISVVADCCGSRSEAEHIAGLDIMKQEGAFTKTTETILFEFLKSSKHPKFKEIQSLIK